MKWKFVYVLPAIYLSARLLPWLVGYFGLSQFAVVDSSVITLVWYLLVLPVVFVTAPANIIYESFGLPPNSIDHVIRPTVCPSNNSASLLSYQSLPTSSELWRGYGQEAKRG